MFTLFHHPFCPHSRFIRLAVAEHGLELRLVEERAWERRHEFLVMNPAGTTPVLVSDGVPAIPGARLTYADLAAAAHLSAIDYLGDVPWNEDETAKTWYARIKSRPSFRPILAEWLAGVPASPTYVDLDF